MKTVLFLGDIYRINDSVFSMQAEPVYYRSNKDPVSYAIFVFEAFDKTLINRIDAKETFDKKLLSLEAHDASVVLDFVGAARYFARTDDMDDFHQLCKDSIADGNHPWWFDVDYLKHHAGLELTGEMCRIIESYNPPSRLFQLPGYQIILEIPKDTVAVFVEDDGCIFAADSNSNSKQVGWTKMISPQRFDARKK